MRPVKLTTAPISVRAAVSRTISAPASKSAVCTRALSSTSGHRRKEGDFAGTSDAGRRPHVPAVDGGADDLGALKGRRVLWPLASQPLHQLRNGGNVRRQIDLLFGLAGLFAHPGEVQKLNPHRLSSQAHSVLDR